VNKKLYVSNLAFAISDSKLEELFGSVGQVVSAKVITDRDTGRSKGFGFVEMSTEAEAVDAIAKLNGTEVEGRSIGVSEARPQVPRENRGGYGGGYNSGRGGPRGRSAADSGFNRSFY
jgi:RNA recognition motif-containing protein